MNTQELFYQYCKSGFFPGIKHLVESGQVDMYSDYERAFKLTCGFSNPKQYPPRSIYLTRSFDYLINIRNNGKDATLNDFFKWTYEEALTEALKKPLVLYPLVEEHIKRKSGETNKG